MIINNNERRYFFALGIFSTPTPFSAPIELHQNGKLASFLCMVITCSTWNRYCHLPHFRLHILYTIWVEYLFGRPTLNYPPPTTYTHTRAHPAHLLNMLLCAAQLADFFSFYFRGYPLSPSLSRIGSCVSLIFYWSSLLYLSLLLWPELFISIPINLSVYAQNCFRNIFFSMLMFPDVPECSGFVSTARYKNFSHFLDVCFPLLSVTG